MKDKSQLHEKNLAYFLYIISLLIFGTNGIIASKISLESSQIVLLRTLLGGGLLTFIVIIRGGFDKESIKKEKVPLLLGGISLGMNWAMLFAGYELLNVSLATLIYYTGPIIVLILSPIFFNEKLSWSKIISIILAGFGLILISANVITSGMNTKGLFFAILSAIFYALVIKFNKEISLTSGLETSAIELIIAFVFLIIYTGFTVGFPEINKADLPYIGIIGFINTGLAYLLYFSSIQKLSGQSVALLSYIDPLSAVILSALFLNESMTIMQIIGSVLIIAGAIFGEVYPRKKK